MKITGFRGDHEDEQHDLTDLINKMFKLCDDEADTAPYMKGKLKEYFEDHIIMTNMRGKSNIVTIRKTAANILHAFNEPPQSGYEEEKLSSIKAAANVFMSNIK
jgi:hypothetical protein